jgi:hypothetical protein
MAKLEDVGAPRNSTTIGEGTAVFVSRRERAAPGRSAEPAKELFVLLFKEAFAAMLPTGCKQTFDRGIGGDAWRSRLSEILAEAVVQKPASIVQGDRIAASRPWVSK